MLPPTTPEQLGDQRLGREPESEQVAVPAIGAGDAVAVLERAREADRDGLLTGVEVRRAVDLAAQEQRLQTILDAADHEHPPVQREPELDLLLRRGAHPQRVAPRPTGAPATIRDLLVAGARIGRTLAVRARRS